MLEHLAAIVGLSYLTALIPFAALAVAAIIHALRPGA